jgi:Cytochrome P460
MKTANLWMPGAAALLGSLIAHAALSEPEAAAPAPAVHGPTYTADNKLEMPANYREWVYLSTGFDMSYSPRAQAGHHMFDNVFVEPGAYQTFKKTGTWPDKTMFALEARGAIDKGSINKGGNYQSTELMGVEVHLKDSSRFPGGWAFFAFDDANAKPAPMIPTAASCYSCHSEHAAVDTTFVQFYPTLLPVAEAKGTLSAGYKHDLTAAK